MTVGTTSTCVVPTSASARHASVVNAGKAITDAPDANATAWLPNPAMWWDGEADAKRRPGVSSHSGAWTPTRSAKRSWR